MWPTEIPIVILPALAKRTTSKSPSTAWCETDSVLFAAGSPIIYSNSTNGLRSGSGEALDNKLRPKLTGPISAFIVASVVCQKTLVSGDGRPPVQRRRAPR